ncbi:BRO family protein [Rhodococcus sp. NPDC079359]|uniref:BRO family protein n=1 Tax=Rhodococcus sp. NPDC079359 TaxID=3154961 RepID=UPI00344DDB78
MPFQYGDSVVRTVLVDGEPWFVLADLCKALRLTQNRNVTARLSEDQKGVRPMDTPGGRQQMTVVNESGMYEVVIRSDKPDAVSFRRWITGTVLPQIRKTGSFGPVFDPATLTRADILKLALAAEEEKAVMAAALESAAPAIAYHDRFVLTDDVVTVKVWGAQFGLTEPQAFNLLRDKGFIYRTSLGERWSASKGRREEVFEHRARAGRVTFDWFDLRPQHNAPRHHNGQVRQTLYVRQGQSLALGAKCGLSVQLSMNSEVHA